MRASREAVVEKLCRQLEAHVNEQAETPDRERITKTWRTDMERLMRIDGRDAEQIAYVIGWLSRDSFWSANVLSANTLRRQFDKLVAKIKSQKVRSGGPAKRPSRGKQAELARRALTELEQEEGSDGERG